MTPSRDIPGVIAPPPLIYLGFLFVGWVVFRFAKPAVVGPEVAGWLSLGFGMETETRRIVSLPLIFGGLLLDGAAAGYFRRIGTNVQPFKPTTVLGTGGPYRFSRNPIYLGFAITYVGLAIAMDSWIALLLLIPCLLVVDRFVIRREERYLSAKFGAGYDAYRARVRRWL